MTRAERHERNLDIAACRRIYMRYRLGDWTLKTLAEKYNLSVVRISLIAKTTNLVKTTTV